MKFLKWIFLTEKVKEQQTTKQIRTEGHRFIQLIWSLRSSDLRKAGCMFWNQLICSWRHTVFLLAERVSARWPPFSVHVPGHSHPAAFHAGERTDSKTKVIFIQNKLDWSAESESIERFIEHQAYSLSYYVTPTPTPPTHRKTEKDRREKGKGWCGGAKSYDTEEPGPL